MLENLTRATAKPNTTTLHHDAVRRDREADTHVLLDEQNRLARLVHQTDVVEHLLEHLWIEPERRLVEQHELRIHHQRARELDQAPLTAREIAGTLPAAVAHDRKQFLDVRVAAPHERAVMSNRIGTEHDVLAHRHLREGPVRLRHLDDTELQHLRRSRAGDLLSLE